MHSRTQIRLNVGEKLRAIQALTDVFDSRGVATPIERTPFANVLIVGETVDPLSDQWQERRTASLEIRLYAADENNAADALDALAEQVEALMCVDHTLGGHAVAVDYRSMQAELEEAAIAGTANLVLHYDVQYIWEPQVEADAFGTVNVQIDMASPRNDPPQPTHPDGQIDAEARITLPQ